MTLNVVLSLEPPQPATPVVFLIRSLLEETPTFNDALRKLSETPIPCDCSLSLTGTHPGELAVIERTPSRDAVRRAVDGFVAVTNGYLELETSSGSSPSSALLGTSGARLDRVCALVRQRRPANVDACINYLSNASVRMQITV